MISVKIASIVAVVAFVSGSFVASPELRAYAAATITSADIVNETIRSEDIKNGQVKASDIATGAVGSNEISDRQIQSNDIALDTISADELVGVNILQFDQCNVTDNVSRPAGGFAVTGDCFVGPTNSGSQVIATINRSTGDPCFVILNASPDSEGKVNFLMKNICSSSATLGTATISIIAFD